MKDGLHQRWRDVRTMLTDWLAWLDETQHWVETTAGDTAAPASSDASVSSELIPEASRADLSTLFEVMTALRQDVNLQTRSARRDRDQASETLDTLSAAVDQLRREAEESASEAADAVHVDVLLDLHDALWRAERQASQVLAATVETLRDWREWAEKETQADDAQETLPTPVADVKPRVFDRLRQWFSGASTPAVEAPEPAVADIASVGDDVKAEAGRMANRLDGLATGYQLSLQRLERALSTCGIKPMACLGQPVDPELMEVVQIVSDAAQPPGIVTDEVRCGYRRHGQVYRFAQVVATRAQDMADGHVN